MGDNNDFAMLYAQLGLQPGCSLHDLRLAYRRRVARLHPDRSHGDIDALQQLNTLYGAALDFQRQMGRLPGAAATSHGTVHSRRTQSTSGNPHAEIHQTSEPEATTRLRTLALLLLILLVAALLWSAFTHPFLPADTGVVPTRQIQDSVMPVHASETRLSLGMDTQTIIAIEGQPISKSPDHWDYGPSWIALHCGAISDWYSSPLRPLRVASSKPLEDDSKSQPPRPCRPALALETRKPD